MPAFSVSGALVAPLSESTRSPTSSVRRPIEESPPPPVKKRVLQRGERKTEPKAVERKPAAIRATSTATPTPRVAPKTLVLNEVAFASHKMAISLATERMRTGGVMTASNARPVFCPSSSSSEDDEDDDGDDDGGPHFNFSPVAPEAERRRPVVVKPNATAASTKTGFVTAKARLKAALPVRKSGASGRTQEPSASTTKARAPIVRVAESKERVLFPSEAMGMKSARKTVITPITKSKRASDKATSLVGSSASTSLKRPRADEKQLREPKIEKVDKSSVSSVVELNQALKAKTASIGHILAELTAISSMPQVRKKLSTVKHGSSGRANVLRLKDDDEDDDSDIDRNASPPPLQRKRLKKPRLQGTLRR